jgi:TIR domain
VKDFFISYNKHDLGWAEWIAWTLEENKFSVVIQAWDFVGNWIMQMDHAMRETERTVAVVSRHYLQAEFTQSEWANAFVKDPTGSKDLLIPIRVEPVELQGLLAQISWIDFTGKSEPEARDLLVNRARGLRGKPSTPRQYPTGSPAPEEPRRSIAKQPVYPAATEDQQQYLRARDAIIRWRGLYGSKLDKLRGFGLLAREWSKKLPGELGEEGVEMIRLAARVAHDFYAINVQELEFARPYGLDVHPTVFWGNATSDVTTTAQLVEADLQRGAQVNAIRVQQGMRPYYLASRINAYGFEMIARVLESASELARYNPDSLPRGYLKSGAVPNLGEHEVHFNDLTTYRALLLTRTDNDPRLHLTSAVAGVEVIGSFSARKLALQVLCAQRNRHGSLDLVAHDWEHLYFWQTPSPQPIMEFPVAQMIEDACFLSREPGSPVGLITTRGDVETFAPDGNITQLYTSDESASVRSARIWVDPDEDGSWCAITLTQDWRLSSGNRGVPTITVEEALWDSAFSAAGENWGVGSKHRPMGFGKLNGLSCVIVSRAADWGLGICFLDPGTLVSLRRPLVIHEFVSEVTIAAGRWLVAALLKDGNEPKHRLMVWDLDSDSDEPVGRWFEQSGDVYHVIVTAEKADSFSTLQVFRTLELYPVKNYFQLVRFDWPSGQVTLLQRFDDLRIWPVELGLDR